MAHEPTAPLRILLVNSSSGLGGAETHVGQLARGLVQRGHEVHVASPADGPLVDAVLAAGAHHHPAPMYPDRPSWGQVRRLGSLMREVGPEVLHLHGVRAGLLGRAALLVGGGAGAGGRIGPRRRTMRPPPDAARSPAPGARATRPAVVYTVHGAHFLHYRPPLDAACARLERALQSITDQVIFVCRSDMEACIAAGAFDGRRGVVIHNGIALPPSPAEDARSQVGRLTPTQRLRDELGIPSNGHLVLAVGRLSPEKDYPTMLRTVASREQELRARATCLVIAGGGPEEASLRALATELGVGGENEPPGTRVVTFPADRAAPLVTFLGPRSDVPDLLQAADVLLLTSLWEGLPYVALEAMAARVPILATRVGGMPEVLADGVTGLLEEPGDMGGLGGSLLRLICEEPLRRRLGAAASDRVRLRFTEHGMTQATEAAYIRALSAPGTQAARGRRA